MDAWYYCIYTAMTISTAGAASSPGPSTPRILSVKTPPSLTPFQCVLGFQPPLFPWMGEPSEVSAVDYWFWASEAVWNSADIHLQRAVWRHKTFADARRSDNPTYQPGDKVWLSTQDLHLHQPCRKLSAHYIGPLPIQKSPTYYNFHPGTAFTLPSTFISLNHSFHLHQDPPSRRHLLLQKSWTSPLSTMSGTFWICSGGVAGWNISLTGMDTAP